MTKTEQLLVRSLRRENSILRKKLEEARKERDGALADYRKLADEFFEGKRKP